jgi:ABC-type branched-subunit amino acid transport system permease subunit
MSLNLLLGYTGQLSLGHGAFFGIGAYASALTTLGFDVELFDGFRVADAVIKAHLSTTQSDGMWLER